MLEELVVVIIDAFGLEATIGVAILSGFSFIASVLDAVWKDHKQPEIVNHLIKFLSVNVGAASNDPERNG